MARSNGGAARRQSPHTGPSPVSTNWLKSFSPQTRHRIPCKGTTLSRQRLQTGRAEIPASGVWQIRQSEGNSTAKRLSAADGSACSARLASPLLLKTTLLLIQELLAYVYLT